MCSVLGQDGEGEEGRMLQHPMCWNPCSHCHCRQGCHMQLSGQRFLPHEYFRSQRGVPSVSWDAAFVQAEVAQDREQRRSEESCDENQAKSYQSHKVRYETLMALCCTGRQVWRTW